MPRQLSGILRQADSGKSERPPGWGTFGASTRQERSEGWLGARGTTPGGNTASSGEGDPLAPSSVVRMTCRDENRATQRRQVPFVTPFVTLSDSSSLQ